jgi:hypothetical protein
MAQPLIVLRNRDRYRLFQATLYHSLMCIPNGKCICLVEERREAHRKGEKLLVEQSIVLLPGQESEPLPAAVLNVPQVQAAIQQRWLENKTALAQIEVISARKEK